MAFERAGRAVEWNAERAGADGLLRGRRRSLRLAGVEEREEDEKRESDQAR